MNNFSAVQRTQDYDCLKIEILQKDPSSSNLIKETHENQLTMLLIKLTLLNAVR